MKEHKTVPQIKKVASLVQKKLRTPPRMENSQDQTDEGSHNSNVPAEGSLKDASWVQKWRIMGWREVGVHDRVRS